VPKTVFLLVISASVLLCKTATSAGVDHNLQWQFMNRFVTPNGAVVDTQNEDISHSEAQGYGMLIAVAADDERQFKNLYQWTQDHLAIRDDGLLAWAWDRRENVIGDKNAATDGDILVAWALLRAADQWNEPDYRKAAIRHIDAIETLTVQHGGRWLIKPGPSGFEQEDALHVNPSYWVYPALADFASVHDGPWQAILEDGLALTKQLLETRAVIPDWVKITQEGEISGSGITGEAGRSGFDAIRVPLYLAWSGLGETIGRTHWSRMQSLQSTPPYVLVRDTTEPKIIMEGNHAGYAAIGALVSPSLEPWRFDELAHDYYPAALQLLSRLAAEEGAQS